MELSFSTEIWNFGELAEELDQCAYIWALQIESAHHKKDEAQKCTREMKSMKLHVSFIRHTLSDGLTFLAWLIKVEWYQSFKKVKWKVSKKVSNIMESQILPSLSIKEIFRHLWVNHRPCIPHFILSGSGLDLNTDLLLYQKSWI